MKKETNIFEDNAGGLHFVTTEDSIITEYGYIRKPCFGKLTNEILDAYHNGMCHWLTFAGIDGNNTIKCHPKTNKQLTANDYAKDIESDSNNYRLIAAYDGEAIVIYPKNCGKNASHLAGFYCNEYF